MVVRLPPTPKERLTSSTRFCGCGRRAGSRDPIVDGVGDLLIPF
jgi:hypothetical protein